MDTPITNRIKIASIVKGLEPAGDRRIVELANKLTSPPMDLDPRVGADVRTAEGILKARSFSAEIEGKPPVA